VLLRREPDLETPLLPDYGTDIRLACSPAELGWTQGLARELRKLLNAELGQAGLGRMEISTDPPAAPDACGLLVPVLSPAFAQEGGLAAALAWLQGREPDALFPLVHTRIETPDALLRLPDYRFWDHAGPMDQTRPSYFLKAEELAKDLAQRLRDRRDRDRFRAEQAQRQADRPKVSQAWPEALIFVNGAPEDRPLLERVIQIFDGEGIGYSFLPFNPAAAPADIRNEIDLNLESCDAVLLVYGQSAAGWVHQQLLYCHQAQRKRKSKNEAPLKVVAIHNQCDRPKPVLPVKLPNLQVFDCPPEAIESYLPRFMAMLGEGA
jgi:hypothetical protein